MKIREAAADDIPAIAKIHVEGWRMAYCGMVPDEYLNSLTLEDGLRRWKQFFGDKNKFAYVAKEESGALMGFASGGRERTGDPDHDGELYAIYVSREHQNQGAGLALMNAVKHRLARQGFHSMLLWCLQESPGCRFFEASGGVKVREREINIGGLDLREAGYSWSLKNRDTPL